MKYIFNRIRFFRARKNLNGDEDEGWGWGGFYTYVCVSGGKKC